MLSVSLWKNWLLDFIIAMLACLHIYYTILNVHDVYMVVLLQCLHIYIICYSVAIQYNDFIVSVPACFHIYYFLLCGRPVYMISCSQ